MRVPPLLLLFTLSLFAESVAGLRWVAPAGWKNEGTRPMRAATYTIAPVSGDHDASECAVYFFGAGQGGSVQANLDRWKDQVHAPGGKRAEAQIQKRNIHGLSVTTIDSSGDYSGMGGPMGGAPVAKGYRLIGAIVEGPGGNVFIKFAGPSKTVAQNQAKFEQMLASFDKAP
ncbi:MAG: hypothetical protein ABSB35_14305 [Bryobacteraceae bacterium]